MAEYKQTYLISQDEEVFDYLATSIKVDLETSGVCGLEVVRSELIESSGEISVTVKFEFDDNFIDLASKVDLEILEKITGAVEDFEFVRKDSAAAEEWKNQVEDERKVFTVPFEKKPTLMGAIALQGADFEGKGGNIAVSEKGGEITVVVSPSDDASENKSLYEILDSIAGKADKQSRLR